jgi:tetratricopeptide (TPR) repeat protein
LALALGAAAAVQAQVTAAVVQARLCTKATGEAAVAPCRKALEPARRRAAARDRATLAARLSALERWEDVVEVYRGAVSRRPADGLARIRLGAALLHMQDRAADAEPELREAIRLRPDDAEAQVLLGDALVRLGRAADAVAAFEQALRLDATVLDHRPAARAAYDAARRGEKWPKP